MNLNNDGSKKIKKCPMRFYYTIAPMPKEYPELTKEDCEDIIKKFRKTYPYITSFIDKLEKETNNNGSS